MNDDKKISELPPTSTLDMNDLLAVVHGGVTSRVTLRDLIKELQLLIPQPRVKIRRDMEKEYYGHDMVYAFWEGSDNRFMKFNPEYWLYRYKPADLRGFMNRGSGERETVWMKKRFVHPSHNHGSKYFRLDGSTVVGQNLYDGEQMISVGNVKALIASRNTEWKLDETPLVQTHLDLDPWKYYRIAGMDPFTGIAPDEFPLLNQPVPRGRSGSKGRFVVFKLRIAIDNPDTSSPQPKIFGPFSETFILFPQKQDNVFPRMKYFLGAEGAPQMRKKIVL